MPFRARGKVVQKKSNGVWRVWRRATSEEKARNLAKRANVEADKKHKRVGK